MIKREWNAIEQRNSLREERRRLNTVGSRQHIGPASLAMSNGLKPIFILQNAFEYPYDLTVNDFN